MLAAAYPTSSLPIGPFESSAWTSGGRRSSRKPQVPTSKKSHLSSSKPLRTSSQRPRSRITRPPLLSNYSTPSINLASFNDDDGGFGGFRPSETSAFAGEDPYASAYSTGGQDDDLLASNPFADLSSSSTANFPNTTQQNLYDEPSSPEPYRSTDFAHEETPATPIQRTEATFQRETAPTPETPAPTSSSYDYTSYETDPYAPVSPLPSSNAVPLSPSEQTPFGDSPTSPSLLPSSSGFYSPPPAAIANPFAPAETSPTHARQTSKPDLSALLGEEKPILPSFSSKRTRERSEGVAGPLGSKIAVLPVSSVGRKPVGGALAALLGLEVEQEEKSQSVPSKEEAPKAGAESKVEKEGEPSKVEEKVTASEEKPQVEEEGQEAEVEEIPLPPDEPVQVEPTTPAALETPLPPSPTLPEAPSTTETSAPEAIAPIPALSRKPSEAPSTLSAQSTATENVAYESMVSPLDNEVDENGERRNGAAWPANKEVDGLESQLASTRISTPEAEGSPSTQSTPTASFRGPSATQDVDEKPAEPTPASEASTSYSQYIFSDESAPAPTNDSPPTNAPAPFETPSRGFRAFNGSGDEGGFGGTSDADSLRGAYSRSVEVGDGEDNEADTGPNSPATEKAAEGSIRSQREGSAPLPPLPTSTVQGSPRSTELGGSLGPSFVITVGDPQKVGNSLNPASQHTVFTVRTRTTSSAFRKNDFSVLRRYSHFVWLYEALMQNNPGVIVPGMPEKHAIGRFGSEFVENRRTGLQAALTKIVAHPMLVGDPDLRLFLESDTFHLDIKQRKLDTHENKGFLANLSSSISGPKFVEFDEYFENRRNALDTFETHLRSLLTSLSAAAKARSVLQASIAELQSAFLALADSDLSTQLRKVLNEAAAVQKTIYDLNEAQALGDEQIGGLVNVAESYARMCASARGVFGARVKAFHTWQAADARHKKIQAEHEKGKRSGRMHSELLPDSVAMLADAERRMLDARHDFDDVSKLTKAEMARFDKEKVDDFKKALEDHADSLALRQREVVAAWQHYHDLLVKVVESNNAAPQANQQPVAAES